MLLVHALQEAGQIYTGSVPNPNPKAPPGVAAKAGDVISYVKWGVLLVIIVAAFVGVGAVAGGRVFAHHGASRVGMSMLISAVIAAVLYAGIYAFITATANA